MSSTGDDDAWRAIVENYGDRPTLPDGDLDEAPSQQADATGPDAPDAPEPPTGTTAEQRHPLDGPDAALARALGAEGRFVPPPPPPIPVPGPRRAVAWAGVLGAPMLLLVLLVAGVSLPSWASFTLVAWFVGGFVYLVLQMPRGPGDPWDDGARV